MKYQIRGSDFAIQLCLLLDVFIRIKQIMARVQSVSMNLWNTVEWASSLLELLCMQQTELNHLARVEDLASLPTDLFPRTRQNASDFANNKFSGKELHLGWLVTTSGKSVKWECQEFPEYIREIQQVAFEIKSRISGLWGRRAAIAMTSLSTILGFPKSNRMTRWSRSCKTRSMTKRSDVRAAERRCPSGRS